MNNIYYLFSVKDQNFTDLSLAIKKNNNNCTFYGLAYAKSPVLKNAIYTHISYISDLINKEGEVDYPFLEQIEKTYQVNISTMIHADRHLLRFKKENRLYIAQELLRLFIKEINEFKIATIIVEGIDDFISFFASYFCQQHDVRLLFPTFVGYSGRTCFASNLYAEPDDFRQRFYENLPLARKGELDVSQVEAEIIKYVQAKKRPTYMSSADANYKSFRWKKDIATYIQYVTNYFADKNGMHYMWNPWLVPFYRIQRLLRKKRYDNLLSNEGVKDLDALKQKNYLIYPLHFEPESSTLVQGRWFNDQRRIIEIISKNMPVDTILIVKEHQPSLGRRSLEYYKEFTNYHNVFLIDHLVDTYPLIEGSKGVVVISSTMGIESLMLKKPVLSFGERFYNVSSNVYVADNFRVIDKQITAMINHEFDWLDALVVFYTLFMTSTDDMGYLSHLEYSNEDIAKLANKLEEFFTA